MVQATVAQLQRGDVKRLGLEALVDACCKSSRVQGIDLSGHDLSQPELFLTLMPLLHAPCRLVTLSLEDVHVTDSQLGKLARTLEQSSPSHLEYLSIAGNWCALLLILFRKAPTTLSTHW
jgi:hypothetical protein